MMATRLKNLGISNLKYLGRNLATTIITTTIGRVACYIGERHEFAAAHQFNKRAPSENLRYGATFF